MIRLFRVLAALLFAVGCLYAEPVEAPVDSAAAGTDDDSPYATMQVLARAMQLIRQDYVDDKKISYHDLTYSALRGMLSDLDPHSEFMDNGEFKSMQ